MGDQPAAIEELTKNLGEGKKEQTLLGVTGSGKTFTMANVIQNVQRPTLVLSHNKTLAAQLYSEFKTFFPENEVHYFVSYFDYYQPEAYMPSSDTYIEKDSKINEEIDRLRHAATSALLSRRDCIIVASVSCIYGIGSRDDYGEMSITLKKGEARKQDKFIRHLTDIQYQRNDVDFHRSTFRVRGDVVPVDAMISKGESSFDESALTGEPLPIEKKVGNELLSGSINGGGVIEAKALRTAENSQYEQIIELVKQATTSKAPFIRMADRYSVVFTIISFTIAGTAFFVSGGEWIRFLQVLVVATPCPLLLGAPIALVSGMSRAAKHGIIVKNGSALEKLARVKTFVFDKTGTFY